MNFKKNIIHVIGFWHQMWLSSKAINVAYVCLMSAVVYQIWALLTQCAALYSVHDDVQYTVIIRGLLQAYHMYHMGYSRVLQTTQLRIRHQISFFMLLCAFISGLFTVWMIVGTFCSLLPWQSAQKALYISLSHTYSIRYFLTSLKTCVRASRHHYLFSITM